MAIVEVRALIAFRCDHCDHLVVPEMVQYRDGPRRGCKHRCDDGTIPTDFTDEVGLTRSTIVVMSPVERENLARSLRLRNQRTP